MAKELIITKEDIVKALNLSLENEFIDNLRNRGPFVQLDSKIRGYLGEICLKKWFRENGIIFDKVNYKDDGTYSLDIDFLYKNKILELKTSLIPEVYKNLKGVIANADIKIIKRNNEKIEDTHGDIHMQIYFNLLRKERDDFCNNIEGNITDYNIEEIISIMKLGDYRQAFIGWIDKETLVKYINNLSKEGKETTWSFGYRQFWRCPLKTITRKSDEILTYLKNL